MGLDRYLPHNFPSRRPIGIRSYYVLSKFGIDRKDEVLKEASNPTYWFNLLEIDLFSDLYAISKETELLDKCALGFLPDIKGNALAVSVGEAKVFGIVINVGLVWFCFVLTQAIILQNESNDSRGQITFDYTKRIFLSEDGNEFARLLGLSRRLVDEKIAVAAGGVGSLLLRFIALHELAHVKYGHADKFGRSCTVNDDGVITIYDHLVASIINERHRDELFADRYALSKLIDESANRENAWGNTLFIYAFFLAMQCIEDETGREICPQHPSPNHRASSIFEYAVEKLGLPTNDAFTWLNVTFNTWRGLYMPSIQFSIRTENPKEVIDQFKGEKELIVDGMEIRHLETTYERGMALEEAIINFALSIVSGIPAGMVANYLYQRFCDDGKNVLRVESELVKDLEDLISKLEDLLDKQQGK